MPHDVAIPVDDFRPRDADGAPPDSSRLDTPRSLLGDGLIFQESSLYVDADGGSGGASVELGPPSRPGEGLDPERLLGPYIKDGWQPRLVGVRLEIEGGYGEVEVQLLDEAGGVLWSATADADRRASAVDFAVELPGGAAAHRLQWFLHEGGYGEVKEVALLAETPDYADEVERSFLYSYGLLSRAWDPERGLVAFRNLWPASDYAAVEGPGLFALATAVAWDLGYVASSDARAVAEAARATYLDLEADPETGLFPRHLAGGGLHPDSYYSSLHTALGLEAAILAGEATGLDTRELTQRLEAIDWSALTDAYEDPISAGVDPAGEPVGWDFGTFGSDAALAQSSERHAHRRGDPGGGLRGGGGGRPAPDGPALRPHLGRRGLQRRAGGPALPDERHRRLGQLLAGLPGERLLEAVQLLRRARLRRYGAVRAVHR